jgi:hypothetical protein
MPKAVFDKMYIFIDKGHPYAINGQFLIIGVLLLEISMVKPTGRRDRALRITTNGKKERSYEKKYFGSTGKRQR